MKALVRFEVTAQSFKLLTVELFQVISVIKRHSGVQKISFIGHSLGGLIARYAIARLYERDITEELSQENGGCESHGSEDKSIEEKFKGKIAGLEPVNFVTIATPHLGSRGHKQVICYALNVDSLIY